MLFIAASELTSASPARTMRSAELTRLAPTAFCRASIAEPQVSVAFSMFIFIQHVAVFRNVSDCVASFVFAAESAS